MDQNLLVNYVVDTFLRFYPESWMIVAALTAGLPWFVIDPTPDSLAVQRRKGLLGLRILLDFVGQHLLRFAVFSGAIVGIHWLISLKVFPFTLTLTTGVFALVVFVALLVEACIRYGTEGRDRESTFREKCTFYLCLASFCWPVVVGFTRDIQLNMQSAAAEQLAIETESFIHGPSGTVVAEVRSIGIYGDGDRFYYEVIACRSKKYKNGEDWTKTFLVPMDAPCLRTVLTAEVGDHVTLSWDSLLESRTDGRIVVTDVSNSWPATVRSQSEQHWISIETTTETKVKRPWPWQGLSVKQDHTGTICFTGLFVRSELPNVVDGRFRHVLIPLYPNQDEGSLSKSIVFVIDAEFGLDHFILNGDDEEPIHFWNKNVSVFVDPEDLRSEGPVLVKAFQHSGRVLIME